MVEQFEHFLRVSTVAEGWSKAFQGNKSLQNASSGIGMKLMPLEGVKVSGGIRGMQITFGSFVLEQ